MSSRASQRASIVKQRLNRFAKEGLNRALSAATGHHLTKGAPGERLQQLQDEAHRARREQQVLAHLYEGLRARFTPGQPHSDVPGPAAADRVLHAVLRSDEIHNGFFHIARTSGSLDDALMASTRLLLEDDKWAEARGFAQILQRYDDLRPTADLSLALGAEIAPLDDTAWKLLQRGETAHVMAHAPDLYFRYAFFRDRARATDLLRRALDGQLPVRGDTEVWLDIALSAFTADEQSLAMRALVIAEGLLPAEPAADDPGRAAGPDDELRLRCAALRRYLDRAPRPVVSAPPEVVSIAVLDFKLPDRERAMQHLAGPIQSLAILGHLLRQRNATIGAAPDLGAFIAERRAALPAHAQLDGPEAAVMVHTVDRDVPNCADVPQGTWVIWSDHFMDTLHAGQYAPFNPNLRPVFVGFEINTHGLIGPGVIDYLRTYAPIGCLNWDTVFLLLAAGVPAFFSGSVTGTLDVSQPPRSDAVSGDPLFVDRAGGGDRLDLAAPDMPERTPAETLRAAESAVTTIGSAGRIVTANVTPYLAARALGVPAELDESLRWSPDYPTFVGMSDSEFAETHDELSRKLSVVLDAILSGKDEEAVYATWRELCAADVDAARARMARHLEPLTLDFDPRIVSDAIRTAAVVVERTVPVDGDEVNIEFSLDGRYKHQLDVVLESVVSNTQRPVRLFVLCRDHGPDDHRRMAQLFPSVSFVWLPTDQVVYGAIAGKVPWASFATMDRTLLPLILPDIDRIVHLDLDLLVRADVGELFDTPFHGRPLAAILEAQDRFRGGFETIRRASDRLRGSGSPELGEELTTRVYSRHPFDFEVFNAGVMVMNLAKMRQDDFCGRFMPFIQRFGVNGQEVLNIYIGDDFERVDPRWNQLVRIEMWDEPRIAHWAGPFKPWQGAWVTGQDDWERVVRRFDERTSRILAGGS